MPKTGKPTPAEKDADLISVRGACLVRGNGAVWRLQARVARLVGVGVAPGIGAAVAVSGSTVRTGTPPQFGGERRSTANSNRSHSDALVGGALCVSVSLQPNVRIHGVEGRYAHALFSAAAKKNAIDSVEQELHTIRDAAQAHAGFKRFLADPTISRYACSMSALGGGRVRCMSGDALMCGGGLGVGRASDQV